MVSRGGEGGSDGVGRGGAYPYKSSMLRSIQDQISSLEDRRRTYISSDIACPSPLNNPDLTL